MTKTKKWFLPNQIFDQLKASIDAKNKIAHEYENEMENIAAQQRKLNVIYETLKLKLLIFQYTKKKKYYSEFLEKPKNCFQIIEKYSIKMLIF